MKRTYESPRAYAEEFTPNEYVAACWKINCNVPTGFGFIDNNKNRRYDSGDEKLTSDGVYGCGVWHKGVEGVPNDGPKANAMWQPQRRSGIFGSYTNNGAAYDVYYWSDGYGQTHRHFSKVSDAQWETNPNAS